MVVIKNLTHVVMWYGMTKGEQRNPSHHFNQFSTKSPAASIKNTARIRETG